MRVAIVVTSIVLMDFNEEEIPPGVDDIPAFIKSEIGGEVIGFLASTKEEAKTNAAIVVDTQVVVQHLQ